MGSRIIFEISDIKNYLSIYYDNYSGHEDDNILDFSNILKRADELNILRGNSEYQDFSDFYGSLKEVWVLQLFRLCESDEAFILSYNSQIYGISSHFNSAKENLDKIMKGIGNSDG